MNALTILVGLATIIAGVIAGIQTYEWLAEKRRKARRKKTFLLSKMEIGNQQKPLKIINFAHPFTPENLAQIKALVDYPIESVIEIKTQLDEDRSFNPQIDSLVDSVGLTSEEWQASRFIVNLPGFSPAAGMLLAELHGRMGHFPTIFRLRRKTNTTPPAFEIAKIQDLSAVRARSREKR